jgi:hypothetical protein
MAIKKKEVDPKEAMHGAAPNSPSPFGKPKAAPMPPVASMAPSTGPMPVQPPQKKKIFGKPR